MSAHRLAATLLRNLFILLLVAATTGAVYCQQPSTQTQTTPARPAQPTNQQTFPQTNPTPAAKPTSTPGTPAPTVSPSAAQTSSSSAAQTNSSITLDEVVRLANAQVSSLQQAQLNERIAAEDVRQAQAAFLPKVTSPLAYIYTSPAIGQPPGEPRVQSFKIGRAHV